MEDNRVRKGGWFLLVGFFVFPWISHAYEVDTHMGLTKATIETFEQSVHKDLSSEEAIAVIEGAAGEDESPRPLNHFFDPVNNRGLKVGVTWPASKVWAEDTRAQASFCMQNWCLDSDYFTYTDKLFSSETDYSWDRAVYEYVHGDKTRGLEGLGHILHLLQDSAVPAHVRNDQHLNKWGIGDFDPYEKFTGKYTQGNISGLGVVSHPKKATLPEYFDTLASFTNTNFLSKDALFDKYPSPALKNMDISGSYAFSPSLKNRVAIIRGKFTKFDYVDNTRIAVMDLGLDPNQLVLEDYWSLLSKEAIKNGVGVMELFFEAVEKEKKTNELKKRNLSQQEIDLRNLTLKLFGVAKGLYGSSLDTDDVSDLLDTQGASAVTAFDSSDTQQSSATSQNTAEEKPKAQTENPKIKKTAEVVETANPTTATSASDQKSEIVVPLTEVLPAPILGGGGSSRQASNSSTPTPADPVITSPLEGAVLGTTTITIEGTAEVGTSITLSATLAGGATTTVATTTSSGGLWNISLSVLEGTTTISVVVANSEGINSSAVTRSFASDTTAPSVSVFSLLECNNSLVTGGTCAGGLQATPSLSAPSSDVASYTYIVDGVVNSTSATLGPVTLSAGSHTVSIAAYDAAGNGATSTSVTIVALSMPVVINEVGWMGTQASGTDQWVELFNQNSGYVINMENVRLATDDWATAPMTGVLSNTDMYLVEKAQTVSDITADHIDSSLSFTSVPAQLRLEYTAGGYATTTIDATPTASACGSVWCAGTDDSQRRSMERTRPDLSGTIATNWNSNNTFAVYGRDSNSTKINGSLKEPNSLGQHNLVQYTCEPPFTTFYAEGGSYVPGGTSCRYYSPTILGSIHYATAFAGTVGSSTQYGGHMTGSLTDTVEAGDVIPSGYDVQGQDLFVSVFTIPPGALSTPYLNQFINYFTTGAEAPPMGNYGIFRFKYGN